jgi:hypothetical protein
VLTYRTGGGAGTAVATPDAASLVAPRAAGMLFSVVEADPDSVTLSMPADFDNLFDPGLFASQLTYVFGGDVNELAWLTVSAHGKQLSADSADAGSDPDYAPIAGTVLFTPTLARPIRRLSNNDILGVAPALATFDAKGELTFDGGEDVRLLAPLWSDLSNTAWRWTATIQPAPGQSWRQFSVNFTGAPGAVINLGSLVS